MKIEDTLNDNKKPLKERYSDYPSDEVASKNGPKYRIVVETERDKELLQSAFEAWHWSRDADTDIIAVNHLVHEYRDVNSIIVDSELYEKVNSENPILPEENE